MKEVLLDVLVDSAKVFIISFILFVVLSFFEEKLTKLIQKHKSVSPIIGSSIGMIPQCGFSIVATDLYIKRHITLGTLFAVFFSCSDEAIPVLLSSGSKSIHLIFLLIFKFIFGFIFGYCLDLIYIKGKEIKEVEEISSSVDPHHHSFEHDHIIHPFLHSLKIFIYVLIINLIFGILIYFIGEEQIKNFLTQGKYITPILCSMVGMIPTCASSILMSELFIMNSIPFGALFTGLCINAGLGLFYLAKSKENRKELSILIISLWITSISLGYIFIGIEALL